MKKLFLFLLIMALIGACSCYKHKGVEFKKGILISSTKQFENQIIKKEILIYPKGKIDFKKDNIGMGYYDIITGDNTVFRYLYSETPVDKTLKDAGYKEEVLFEIKGKLKEMELKDKELSKIHLLVGIHGFFRKAGVYPVKKGLFRTQFLNKKLMKVTIKIEDPSYMVRKKEIQFNLPIPQENDK